jgi:hypothetical protein
LDSKYERNRLLEAYRQTFLEGRCESPGRNASERGCGLEILYPEG